MNIKIKDNCINCYLCIPLCPVDSIFIDNGKFYINNGTCVGCHICYEVCDFDAISIN